MAPHGHGSSGAVCRRGQCFGSVLSSILHDIPNTGHPSGNVDRPHLDLETSPGTRMDGNAM